MNRPLARRRALAALLALTAIVAIVPAAQAQKPRRGDANVSVMTRNLYLGTDLIPIATAPTLAEFEQRATAGFNQVRATNFPARARLIAREVKRTRPDLIGLQEAALWRTGPKDGAATRATTVAYDYVKLLIRALRRTGLRYSVARSTNEADIEGPTSGSFDVRLTMRDVVLVNRQRRGLRIVGRGGGNYQAKIDLPTQAGVFTVLRGYAYADARLGNRRFRFVDTHLEAYLEPTRVAQARELVAPSGPLKGRRVVLVGDMNSDPNGAGGSPPGAWNVLTAAGLRDTWLRLYPRRPGYECCLKTDSLTDPPTPSPFDHRIDQVFVRGRVTPLSATIVGTNPATSRTGSGLWASDHGGVVTRLRLK